MDEGQKSYWDHNNFPRTTVVVVAEVVKGAVVLVVEGMEEAVVVDLTGLGNPEYLLDQVYNEDKYANHLCVHMYKGDSIQNKDHQDWQ